MRGAGTEGLQPLECCTCLSPANRAQYSPALLVSVKLKPRTKTALLQLFASSPGNGLVVLFHSEAQRHTTPNNTSYSLHESLHHFARIFGCSASALAPGSQASPESRTKAAMTAKVAKATRRLSQASSGTSGSTKWLTRLAFKHCWNLCKEHVKLLKWLWWIS